MPKYVPRYPYTFLCFQNGAHRHTLLAARLLVYDVSSLHVAYSARAVLPISTPWSSHSRDARSIVPCTLLMPREELMKGVGSPPPSLASRKELPEGGRKAAREYWSFGDRAAKHDA